MLKRQKEQCLELIQSEDYLDIILIGNIPASFDVKCVQPIDNQIAIGYVKRKESCQNTYFTLPPAYARMPNIFALEGLKGVNRSGSEILKGQPNLNFTGKGVLVGIIDTGINFTHEVFLNKDQTTKILSIWDQADSDGEPPDGLGFGTLYQQTDINAALKSKDPYGMIKQRDVSGHGTALAALACGERDEAEEFYGVAPDAKLLIVKLRQAKQCLKDFYNLGNKEVYSETDILLSISFLYQQAKKLKQPIVILFAGEAWLGPHRSRQLLPLEIVMADLGRERGVVFLSAAGDEGDQGHHYRGRITNLTKEEKEYKKQVQFYIDSSVKGLFFSVWVNVPNILTGNLTSPQGASTGVVPYQTQKAEEFSFMEEKTKVTFFYVYRGPIVGQEVIYISLENPTQGLWTLEMTGRSVVDGEFNIWLPTRSIISRETSFLEPDPNTTVVIPATTNNTITIGAYDGVYDSLYSASGRGMTVDGAVKPDLVELGVNMTIPGQEGDSSYTSTTGTSAAAAVATGKAALLLEWAIVESNDPAMDTILAKSYFIGGSNKKDSVQYPSPEWGYGSINLENSILNQSRVIF